MLWSLLSMDRLGERARRRLADVSRKAGPCKCSPHITDCLHPADLLVAASVRSGPRALTVAKTTA